MALQYALRVLWRTVHTTNSVVCSSADVSESALLMCALQTCRCTHTCARELQVLYQGFSCASAGFPKMYRGTTCTGRLQDSSVLAAPL